MFKLKGGIRMFKLKGVITMSSRIKKLAFFLVVSMLASSMLLACGNNDTRDETTPTEGRTMPETVIDVPGETMWFDEPVTVTWYYPGGEQDDEGTVWSAFNERLKARTNITVDFKPLDWGAYNDQMEMMYAGNEEFDICFTANWINNFYINVARGAFLKLDDIIDNVAPVMHDKLPEFVFTAGEYHGDVYALANNQIVFTQWSFLIQKNLADKYGLEIEPFYETTDILEQMRMIEPFLQEIADNEPGLFPVDQGVPVIEQVREIIPGTGVPVKVGDESIQALSVAETHDLLAPFWEIEMDWFNRGFIRPDAATVTDTGADKNNLRYAVWYQPYKPGGLVEAEGLFGTELVTIRLGEPFLSSRAGHATMNAIGRTSKNPEAAVTVLRIMHLDKDLYNLFLFGIEGVHHDRIDENTVRIIEGGGYNNGGVAWMFGNQFNAYYMEGQQQEGEEDVWEATDRMNREAYTSPLTGFNPDLEPIRTVLPQVQAVDQIAQNAHFVFADNPEKYDEFIEDVIRQKNDAGYEIIREEIQRQIDEWKASQ